MITLKEIQQFRKREDSARIRFDELHKELKQKLNGETKKDVSEDGDACGNDTRRTEKQRSNDRGPN